MTRRAKVGGLLAALFGVLLFAGSALAITVDIHQKLPIAWNASSLQLSASECAALLSKTGVGTLSDSDVIWHFVETSAGTNTGDLTVTFDGATGTTSGTLFASSGSTLQWYVLSKHENLTAASSDVGTANSRLQVSGICAATSSGGGGGGATEDFGGGAGTLALALALLAIGGFGFLASTNRLPKIR